MTSLQRCGTTVLLFVLVSFACGRLQDQERELARFVPNIDTELARRLAAGDDSAVVSFGRERGVYPLRVAAAGIVGRFHVDSAEDYRRNTRFLLPYLERVAAAYEIVSGSGRYARETEFWSNVSETDGLRMRVLRDSKVSVLVDTTKSASQKIDLISGLLSAYVDIGYLPEVGLCKYEIANLLAGQDKQKQLRYYHLALEDFERAEMFSMTSQILGILGHEAAVRGDNDSVFVYWNRARAVAEQYRLPYHAARIYEFYARYYRTEGRLALSHDLFREAQEVCKKYKGGYREFRFLMELVEFYADLGCWDLAGRLLQRARVLESQLPADMDRVRYPPVLKADLARARYLMSKGFVADAEAILERTRSLLNQQAARDQYPRYLYNWSKDLLDNGLADKALPFIEEGLARAQKVNYPYLIPIFHLLSAEAELRRGNYNESEAALGRFEQTTADWPAPYQLEWMKRDAILTGLFLARHDSVAAVAALEEAFSRLRGYSGRRDASTHEYLWLNRCGELRRLLHRINRNDPELGYAVELFWRGLHGYPGDGAPNARSRSEHTTADSKPAARQREDLLATRQITALAARAKHELGRRNDIHCVYQVEGGVVRRFTASPREVTCDTLEMATPEMRELVTEAWVAMAEDPADRDAPVAPALAATLRNLATALLPSSVLGPGTAVESDEAVSAGPNAGGGYKKKPRLLITGDGFLSSFPFETLNLSADGSYFPLLADRDVAYVRTLAPPSPGGPKGIDLLLINPKLPASMRRRLSLQQELTKAPAEAAAVSSYLSDPVVLEGHSATKQRLSDVWENASFIYLAAHFLTNPETPYLTLLPLAEVDGDAGPASGYVEIRDILSSDLRKCRLAVLSGCATGAPYMLGESVAPSFGDAFLDAGADAVVQTFWDVRDDRARDLMSEFMRVWKSVGESPVRALCDARRAALQGPNGVRHPFNWAAYSIKLARLH